MYKLEDLDLNNPDLYVTRYYGWDISPIEIKILNKVFDLVESSSWGSLYRGRVSPALDNISGNHLNIIWDRNLKSDFDFNISDWLAKKIKLFIIKARQKNPQLSWGYDSEAVVEGIPVKEFVNLSNKIGRGSNTNYLNETQYDGGPYISALKNLPNVEESSAQTEEEDEEDLETNSEMEPNTVSIVFDENKNKFRAKGTDGEHGELWVRFPDPLRIEGKRYKVDSLEYAEGTNGNGYYKVHGSIREIPANESLEEDVSGSKTLYKYEGPIYRFGRLVKPKVYLETQAVSEKQAYNNLLFKAAEAIGYDRSKGANVSIDPDCMWEEIEDFIDSEIEVCPECGAPLNDGGTCPKCDDGEEEYGIA